MKDGDRLIQAINRMQRLRNWMYAMISEDYLVRDKVDWLDFIQANRN